MAVKIHGGEEVTVLTVHGENRSVPGAQLERARRLLLWRVGWLSRGDPAPSLGSVRVGMRKRATRKA